MRKTIFVLALAVLSSQLNARGFGLLEKEDDFAPYYYFGAGLSYSFLDPERDGVTAFKVSDNNDIGFRLHGGYRLDNLWAGEFFYQDLGSAQIANVIPGTNKKGDVGYKVFGAHADYFFFQDLLKDVDTFLKLGISTIDVSENVHLLSVDEEKSFTIMTGLGATRAWKNNWDFRFDMDFYSRDAAAISIGLQHKIVKEKQVQPADTDQDGVADSADQCPDTEAGKQVDLLGCQVVEVVETKQDVEQALRVIDLKSIKFEVNSAQLTGDSYKILDEAIIVLLENPGIQVEVSAHTDSDGTVVYNQRLSQNRAESVRSYLIEKGVSTDSLTAVGHGETQPLTDNATAEGKAQNRRVEFKIELPDDGNPVIPVRDTQALE